MNTTSLDSNVVLRIVLDDLPGQSSLAAKVITTRPCYVTDVVITECVFVLDKVYELERKRIAALMSILFKIKTLVFNETVIKTTFELYERWRGLSFVDCYSFVEAEQLENDLLTFDRALIKKGAPIAKEPK